MEVTTVSDPLLRTGSSGSITGFDVIDLGQDGTVEESRSTPFSMAELLHEFAMVKRSLNPHYLKLLSNTIEAHTLDMNNPHRVSLKDLVQDVPADVLSHIVPGTPPASDPSMVLDPIWVPPGTTWYRSTSTVVTTDLGALAEVPAHVPAITHVDGRAGMLMTHALTNYVESTNATVILATNTRPGAVLSYGGAPLSGHDIIGLRATGGSVQSVGVDIGHAVVTGIVGVGLCVRPLATTGYIVLRNRGDITQRIVYDLSTRTVVDATYPDHVRLESLSGGWVRITGAFNFLVPSPDPTLSVYVADAPDGTTVTPPAVGGVIADVCLPTVVVGAVWSPVILRDDTHAGSVGDTLVTIDSGLRTSTQYLAVITADAAYATTGRHGFASMGPWCQLSLQSGGIQTDAHGVIDLRSMSPGLGDATCVIGYAPGMFTAATRGSTIRTPSAPLTGATTMTLGPFTGIIYDVCVYPTAPDVTTPAFFVG